MGYFVWMVVLVLALYTIIPTLLVRLFGWGAYRKGNADRTVFLTFDDGPDPDYTPRLLDLLKRYQIRATFFVLGSKAVQYPELIMRMKEEGHLVGIHNYSHWTNAFMTPRRVRRQLNHAVGAIESITGEKPVYYRPPWGIINLFDFLLLKDFRLVLWSLIVGDWRSRGGTVKIKHRLLSRFKDGAVIVLHDSGQTIGANSDAPEYMLQALHAFIEEMQRKQVTFHTVDEIGWSNEQMDSLSWYKRLPLSLWLKWEGLYHSWFELEPVDPDNRLLYYRVCTYHGKRIALPDGEEIRKGDRVIELHFNNEMMFRIAMDTRSMMQLAVQLVRAVQQIMPKMTERFMNDETTKDVKGIYGITMINRGPKQLGFTVTDLPRGIFFVLTKLYLRTLLVVVHPQGKKRLEIKKELLTPKILAISTKELQKRYSVSPGT
ncbi:polysaccharide deacetylase family protein [Paenibacillus sp. OAS669]|uniref:polysaccharide deacetylase family protein n=1 Tax=Paenibacillus sp. OAS669 TaxID=2663821 RepID=UPI00178A9D69|nr:polysaccharide deacetylase family protein [Paenibacillus sp. OAS669]MBE1443684.1 peptidoglycan/xylan/chitin deacetylase (PgdA/CDA1 family) [Paenibacillus sp. OAS669]